MAKDKDRRILFNSRRPTDHLPVEVRALLAENARNSATISKGRRKLLPRNWRMVVEVVIGEHGGGIEDLAHALGLHRQTFRRLRDEMPEIDEAISAADSRFKLLIISGITKAALAGNLSALQWIAARKWASEFGDKPLAPPTNNTLVLPQGMKPDEVRALFAPQITHEE